MREFFSEQGKRFPLNQDKSFVNLQERISITYGPLSQTALETEKEALPDENSEVNPEEENSLITISYLMDQITLLLG